MGAPQQREINARISITMRASLIIVSLSCILYAVSASQESTVPEDSLFELDDELAEARATVEAMTSDGKSYKDCEKLVTDTKNDITTSVTTNQKIIDALPRGDHCPTVAVQTKKILEEKTKCAATLKISIEQETKASQAQVVFGKSTFSSLKASDCNAGQGDQDRNQVGERMPLQDQGRPRCSFQEGQPERCCKQGCMDKGASDRLCAEG